MNIIYSMPLTLGMLLLALLGTGCATTRTVERNPADAYEHINRRAPWDRVDLVFVDGSRSRVDELRVTPDSATWTDPGTGATHRVATGEIAEVQGVVSRGRGALHGLGIGVGGGALTGAVFGAATHSPGLFSRGETALIGAILFGGLGLVIGPVAGLAVGSKTTYVLDPAEYDAVSRRLVQGDSSTVVQRPR